MFTSTECFLWAEESSKLTNVPKGFLASPSLFILLHVYPDYIQTHKLVENSSWSG